MKEQQFNSLNQEQLNKRIQAHELWLQSNQSKGEALTLSKYDLSNLSFKNAKLIGANLSRCRLNNCDFSHVDMESINITESEVCKANFYQANLTNIDAKYIRIDEYTNFEETLYERMVIDAPTADFLPAFMDRNVMQIIEEHRLTFKFIVEKSNAHIVRGIFDDLNDILLSNYNNKLKTSRSMDGNTNLELTIEGYEQNIIEEVKQDIFNFQRFLKGDKTIAQIVDDPIIQERIYINQKFREFQIEHQKQLVRELGIVTEQAIFQTLPQLAAGLAEQLRNNILPAGPQKNTHADCIVTLPNGNRKAIDADKVVFIEKHSGEYPRIYTTEEKEGFDVDELMSNLATELSKVFETIIMVHKSYIVNLKYLNKKENASNLYKIYSNMFPDKALLVGQNHKKRFNDLIVKHNITLENI